jgi:hypothetical protein
MSPEANEAERSEAALTGCKFYIGMQRALIDAQSDGSLPEKARDQFSLGYLSGFVDGWMQAFSVENESRRMTALGKVFEEVFGSDWDSCLSDSLAHMHSGNVSFMYGMSLGGSDAFEGIRNGMNGADSLPKLTWARHVTTGLNAS